MGFAARKKYFTKSKTPEDVFNECIWKTLQGIKTCLLYNKSIIDGDIVIGSCKDLHSPFLTELINRLEELGVLKEYRFLEPFHHFKVDYEKYDYIYNLYKTKTGYIDFEKDKVVIKKITNTGNELVDIDSTVSGEKINYSKTIQPTFDSNNRAIRLGDKLCKLPYPSIQFYTAKKLFNELPETKLLEEDIVEYVDKEYDKSKSKSRIYDAIRSINKKVKKELGLEELIKQEASKYWVRKV